MTFQPTPEEERAWEKEAEERRRDVQRSVLGGLANADTSRWALPVEKKTRGANPETAIQKAILDWLRLHNVYAFRVSNQPRRLPNGKMIFTGTKGVSDIVGILPGGTFIGIEVKTATGRLSEHQKRFEERVRASGGVYVVVRSVDDCEALIKPLLTVSED